MTQFGEGIGQAVGNDDSRGEGVCGGDTVSTGNAQRERESDTGLFVKKGI